MQQLQWEYRSSNSEIEKPVKTTISWSKVHYEMTVTFSVPYNTAPLPYKAIMM